MLDVSNYNNNSRELNAFWDNFLSKVKERVNYMQYTTWFSKTRLVTIDNSKAIVIKSYNHICVIPANEVNKYED